ncbi:MAG: PEP-CTERM sorting domain-containing protein [bacterium]|nr:PEP-CTERM sorting domain-containing protein [bacterium]
MVNGSGIIPGTLANPSGAGINVVPEPGTLALVFMGLIALHRVSAGGGSPDFSDTSERAGREEVQAAFSLGPISRHSVK